MKNLTGIACLLIFGFAESFSQAEPHLIFKLDVNRQIIHTYKQSDPLIFSLRFSTSQQLSYNQVVMFLPDHIKEDHNEMLRLDSIFNRGFVFYSEEGPWYNNIYFQIKTQLDYEFIELPIHILSRPDADTFIVGFNEVLNIDFGIDPGDFGKYVDTSISLRAAFIPHNSIDTIFSNDVSIIVPDSSEEIHELSNAEKRNLARYWLRRGDCHKVEEIASDLYGQNPNRSDHPGLLAEALECLGDYRTAMVLYQKALSIAYENTLPGQCPPVYYQQKVNELQMQLLMMNRD